MAMKPSNAIDKYRVTYSNGFVQEKWLIEHQDYVDIARPKLRLKYAHEVEYHKTERKEDFEIIQALGKELKEMFGVDWFTNQSPMFYAIETGELVLPATQGGIHKCRLEKI